MSMTRSRQPFGNGGNHHRSDLPRSRRRIQRSGALLGVLGLIAAGATYATATPVEAPPTGLSAVGPVSSEHGFPAWYKDSGVPAIGDQPAREPLKVEQCLDLTDEMCDPAFLAGEMQDPNGEMSFPENWPMESFYMAADASMATAAGDADLTLALEATFATDDPGPAAGEQMVFGRVRIRIDTPSAGTYTVTHPYGKDVFTASAGDRGINFTQDIGASVGVFAEALKSRINPFLTWDTGLVETERGKYLGDPSVPHKVTGSLLGTNFFRVEGPNVGGPGINVIETDLFNLMGKVATNDGIDPGPVTYTETETGGTHLNVFAKAGSGDAVEVTGDGITATTLGATGENFFGRLALTGEPPATVKLSNLSDIPVAVSAPVPVTDLVVVSGATYSVADQSLTVTATTSDRVDPPTLTVDGILNGDGSTPLFVDGVATVTGLTTPPSSVKVTSNAGGSDSAPVAVTGDSVGTVQPTTAVAVGPSAVVSGQTVVLDGSSSMNATGHTWTQVPNEGEETITSPVTLDTTDPVKPSFTAPTGPAMMTFTLTVQGPDGPVTSSPLVIQVTGSEELPVAAPTATLSTAMVGQTVTVSGAGSTNASSYLWTQETGTAVLTAENATSPSFSFTMPVTSEPLTFTLTVTSPLGTTSAPATVTVASNQDALTVADAELRTRKTEWRINGTASITTSNNVSVYLQNVDGTKGDLVGTAAVTPAAGGGEGGTWTIRSRDGVSPGESTMLIVESSKGGWLDDVPYSSRR